MVCRASGVLVDFIEPGDGSGTRKLLSCSQVGAKDAEDYLADDLVTDGYVAVLCDPEPHGDETSIKYLLTQQTLVMRVPIALK